MIGYYFRLALISLRASPGLSLLKIAAIALGIGVCMSVITVNYLMGSDPIPQKSALLHHVQLDSWDPNQPYTPEGEPPEQVTYLDARALLAGRQAFRQTANTGAGFIVTRMIRR